MKIVAADIGGTNARFALAELRPGEPPALGPAHRYPSAEHSGLASAWRAFARDMGGELPRAASIGVAAAADQDILRFVNSSWIIDRHELADELGLERMTLLNDFGATAHAVTAMRPDDLAYVAGPDGRLPGQGIATVIGPGTGLGVAMLMRREGQVHVIETEGGHIGFAPLDEEEEKIEHELLMRFGRVSVERVVSGPGLLDLYRALGGRAYDDAIALWTAALAGSDEAAVAALDRLVRCFGSVAGDLALAHGSNAVVISSSLSRRMAEKLRTALFATRFTAKGRYRSRMEGIPVRLVTHEEPGLLGAAMAFQREHLA